MKTKPYLRAELTVLPLQDEDVLTSSGKIEIKEDNDTGWGALYPLTPR